MLEDIALDSFPDCFLLVLDSDCIVRHVNDCTLKLLMQERASIEGCTLKEISPVGTRLCSELKRMKGNQPTSVSGIFEIDTGKSASLRLDIQATSLFDSDNRLIGYILTGKLLQGRTQLRLLYKLSQREIEITEEIIQGKTTPCIADSLAISQRTVKTHITHIFRKLEVQNRIQLYRLLRENDLISHQPADRSLLLLHRNTGCSDA